MQKVKVILVLFAGLAMLTSFHPDKKKKDLWQGWTEIQQLMQQQKKPIIIDIYTDWCVYCKKMDASTYQNDSVYNFMKEHFYRFRFNGESKDTLVWHDKKFAFNKLYQIHDFVQYVSQGSIVFPTTVIITPDGQPYSTGGMLKVKEMETLLKYYGTNAYQEKILPEFSGQFQPIWK
jgi:thioredoxin-related protein